MIQGRNERGEPLRGSREWCRSELRIALAFSHGGNFLRAGMSLGELLQVAIDHGLAPRAERLEAITADSSEGALPV